MEARLVVLGPEHAHASGTEVTGAREMVAKILEERAAGPRVNRNMLVFLAPDKARLDELREAARFYLAWRSISDEWEELNLDAQQRRHAESQTKHFNETVQQRVGETFIWMLTPRQELGSAEVSWEQTRLEVKPVGFEDLAELFRSTGAMSMLESFDPRMVRAILPHLTPKELEAFAADIVEGEAVEVDDATGDDRSPVPPSPPTIASTGMPTPRSAMAP
jgi:hypothetical protein